jgi:hypothetical protein
VAVVQNVAGGGVGLIRERGLDMVAFGAGELRGAGDLVAGMTHTCGIDRAAEHVAKRWLGWFDS